MANFNELQALYNSYSELAPTYSAVLSNSALITISVISVFLLMTTLTFDAKTKSFSGFIINILSYTILAALSALAISFSILAISSHLGVYT